MAEIIVVSVVIGVLAGVVSLLFDDMAEETHTTVFLTIHIHEPPTIDAAAYEPIDDALFDDLLLEGLLASQPSKR